MVDDRKHQAVRDRQATQALHHMDDEVACGPREPGVTQGPSASSHTSPSLQRPPPSLLPPKVLAFLLMLFLLPGMTTDLLLTLPSQFKRQLH